MREILSDANIDMVSGAGYCGCYEPPPPPHCEPPPPPRCEPPPVYCEPPPVRCEPPPCGSGWGY